MRTVAHWDADRFFASVEQAADRRLRNRPVVVGGDRRGIILSASPEARRLGIRPGWPTSRARRAVPALIVIPAHFELYERFFDQILGLCRESTPLIETAGVGAAWLDLTGTERVNHKDPIQLIAQLRGTVHNWLRVTLSAGIATNKLVARIAARVRKPGALVTVPPGEERHFLAPLPLAWLPGVEREALAALEVAGVRSFGQFAAAPTEALASVLGKQALPLQRRAQGVSEEPVGRKAARVEEGWREHLEFSEDVWDEPVLHAHLRRMAEKLMAQVRAAKVEIRRVSLEIRYTDRDECRRSFDLSEPGSLDTDVFPLLPGLLEAVWTRRVRLRAMTLAATRAYRPSPQMNLFEPPPEKRDSDLKLAAAIDSLRRHYGDSILRRADTLLQKSA